MFAAVVFLSGESPLCTSLQSHEDGASFNTDDAFIGCGVTSVDDGTQFAFCQAQDAEGDLIFCAVDSAILIESIKSITSDSVIQFQWDDTGLCTVINVAMNSYAIRRARNTNWGL